MGGRIFPEHRGGRQRSCILSERSGSHRVRSREASSWSRGRERLADSSRRQADVILLMKVGIKNVVALNGTKVPDTIIKLTKDKEVTAFLDGDRAGDLILKELQQVADIDYVARAPFGKEVEELTPKEIMKALRERVPINLARPVERPERVQFARPERR